MWKRDTVKLGESELITSFRVKASRLYLKGLGGNIHRFPRRPTTLELF